MMRFQHIEYLWGLLALIPLLVLFLLYRNWQKRAFRKFGDHGLVKDLMPLRSALKSNWKFFFASLAVICLVIGLANPQLGTKYEKVKRKGIDVIVALDVSKSMLADDITPNRLLKSRQFISGLIDELSNDRIGLIVFAGNAYLQMPLTVDHAAGKMYLKTVNTELVPTQGTAIGEAIRLAMESFETEEQKYKALVVITDGENHEGDALEAAKEAAQQGVVVHTIGVGTDKGAPIPVYNQYGRRSDYKRDKEGNIVLSRLNAAMLKEVSDAAGGQYFPMGNGRETLTALGDEIGGMEAKEFDEMAFTDYEDQFQYFLGAAFVFMLISFLLSERKGTVFNSQSKARVA